MDYYYGFGFPPWYVGMRYLGWYTMFVFLQMWFCELWPLYPLLCCPKDNVFSYMLTLFVMVLLWTWTFNYLTEAFRVSDVSSGFLQFLWVLYSLIMGWICWISPSGNIGSCPECFPLVDNPSHCTMMDFKLFGIGLITLWWTATIGSLRSLLTS